MTEPRESEHRARSQMLVVVSAFTNVHEAHLARSVLQAAGIDAHIADEHLVSMMWTYSNAVGGVKVLVPEEHLEEASQILAAGAEDHDTPMAADQAEPAEPAGVDRCPHCGGTEFTSRPPGLRFAVASWLLLGVPLGSPARRLYCRQCGEPAEADSTQA